MKDTLQETEKRKVKVLKVIDCSISAAILLTAVRLYVTNGEVFANTLYVVLYLLLAASRLLQTFATYRKDRAFFVKNICFAAVFVICAVLAAVMGTDHTCLFIIFVSYFSVLLADRVFKTVRCHRPVNIVWSIIVFLAIMLYIIMCLSLVINRLAELRPVLINLYALFISINALIHIIAISFSQIRFDILKKIIRKTFAAQILIGLVLLIASFSVVLYAIEPDIETFFDAVWYCFAIVTTIGFGDIAAVTVAGRVLSIILGIYGIVVVAIVTSVIVNFYNEVKDRKDDEADEEQGSEAAKEHESPDITG